MTTHIFYALIPNIVLLPLLHRQMTKRRWLAGVLVIFVAYGATIMIPLVTTSNWLIITTKIIMINIISTTTLRISNNRYLSRTIMLFVNVLITIVVVGNTHWVQGFNEFTTKMAATIVQSNALLSRLNAKTFHTIIVTVSGLLIATGEINNPIVLILKRSNLMPEEPRKRPEDCNTEATERTDEPARGRAIGYLERAVVFILTVTGNLSAIGLVLAAKGIARFQQMDDRNFAEYVLIGTLLSISAAMFIGIVVREFI